MSGQVDEKSFGWDFELSDTNRNLTLLTTVIFVTHDGSCTGYQPRLKAGAGGGPQLYGLLPERTTRSSPSVRLVRTLWKTVLLTAAISVTYNGC